VQNESIQKPKKTTPILTLKIDTQMKELQENPEMTTEEILLAFKPQIHSKELLAVKLLYMLFWNWTDKDRKELLLKAPTKKIRDDINYVFDEKFPDEKIIKKLGGLSNALMSEFFLNLNQDTAEYVLSFACEKNKGYYL